MPETDPYLPLTETVLLILTSLADRPKHGYTIMQDVTVLSDGRVQMSTGTLYGALKRLQEQGLIERYEAVSPDETSVNLVNNGDETGRPRKDYRLSDLGLRVLTAELRRLERLTAAAQRRLRGQEGV